MYIISKRYIQMYHNLQQQLYHFQLTSIMIINKIIQMDIS